MELVHGGRRIAKRLLAQLRTMFEQWARIRDGTESLRRRRMAPICTRIEVWLGRGTHSRCKCLRTLCTQLFKLKPAL